jgi:hypothetical protein
MGSCEIWFFCNLKKNQRRRAAEAVAKNPGKSDRAIAADAGLNRRTVSRARQQLVHGAPVVQTDSKPSPSATEPKRVGKDGKARGTTL